jgi:hypothetical protein
VSHPYRKHVVMVSARARRKIPWKKVPWKLLGIFTVVAFAMFWLGYLLAVRVLFPPPPEPEDGIVVPSLTGMTVDQAQDALRAVGLRLTEVTEIEHPSVPEGLVIAQSPLFGQQLRELDAVRVAISAGPAKVHIDLPSAAPDSSAEAAEPPPDTVPTPEPAAVPDTVPDSVSFRR